MKNIYFNYVLVLILMAATNLCGQNYNNLYTLPDQPDNTLSSTQSSMVIDADGATVSIQNNEEGAFFPSPSFKNALVTKVDVNGNIIWQNQYGAPNYDDEVNAICKTDDGGYLVVGSRGKVGIEYRGWVLRLDNNGNKLWDYLVDQPSEETEFLLVARTSESAENYMIIGKTRSTNSLIGSRVIAMKIHGGGTPYWHYIYNRTNPYEDLELSDLPTSLVQDTELSGIVVAGLCTEGFSHDHEDGGMPTGYTDLFTIGIGLDGSISRTYKKHNIFITSSIAGGIESKPHIIQDSRNNGNYVMVFGTDFSNFESQNGSYFTFMQLSPNLTPYAISHYANEVFLYTENTANAIHADANGNYGISCNTADDTGYLVGEYDQTSFLYLDDTGGELAYVRYNEGTDAKSIFLDYDDARNNFVLKTLNQDLPNLGLGLIKTQMNGDAQCSQQEFTERLAGYFESDLVLNEVGALNDNPFAFASSEWSIGANELNCAQFSNSQSRADLSFETDQDNIDLLAIPSIVDNSIEGVSVSFEIDSNYDVELMVVDIQGMTVYKKNVFISKGNNQIDINTDVLSYGVNTIILSSENKIIGSTRITKF